MTESTSKIIFYTDDDVNGRAIRLARHLGVEIVTANEAGMRGAYDQEHFDYALERRYILVTGNITDYENIYYEWAKSGDDHPGMVLIAADLRTSTVRIAKELETIAKAGTPSDLVNFHWRIQGQYR